MEDRRKLIEENRDLFDDKEPLAGHADRFQALLDKQQSSEKRRPIKKSLIIRATAVAASIAILIGIGVKFYAPKSINAVPDIENNNIMNEFQATNDYYNQQMEEYIADIMCKLANTDVSNQNQLSTDLQKIIDNNTSFVEEMKKNENKEMALRYLVKHYKANIQALENIDKKLGKYTNC